MNGWSRSGALPAWCRLRSRQSLPARRALRWPALWRLPRPPRPRKPSGSGRRSTLPTTCPPACACHFRKVFPLRRPRPGRSRSPPTMPMTCMSTAAAWLRAAAQQKLVEHDVSRFLTRGANVIAIKVTNRTGKTAALVARVTVKERNGHWQSHSTDGTWKTELSPLPLWNTALYNDRAWANASAFAELNAAAPASDPAKDPMVERSPRWTMPLPPGRSPSRAAEPAGRGSRFSIDEAFQVQSVLTGEETGSLTAMTFNEFGHILAPKEGGGLLLIYDGNDDKIPEKVRTYCDKVQNIQGILALNGEVFVTGEGPDGPGLYRLADKDRDGVLENVRTLIRFECEVLEHGAHGLVLGPDGLIYVLLGNHAKLVGNYDDGSPHRDYYEGRPARRRGTKIRAATPSASRPPAARSSAPTPRAAACSWSPAACGIPTTWRSIATASCSSTMPTWNRTTAPPGIAPRDCATSFPAANTAGAAAGPSGPTTSSIRCPPLSKRAAARPRASSSTTTSCSRPASTARSSPPTGRRAASWPSSSSGAARRYTASSEVFLEGNPLNVTDLEVGPDGWLYFTTGGRGTAGGIYRVVWRGQVPAEVTDLGTGLTTVIRQPQVQASYARQNIAAIRKQMGSNWDHSLIGVARSAANPAQYRLQALDLMQLFGPPPTPELLDRAVAGAERAGPCQSRRADGPARHRRRRASGWSPCSKTTTARVRRKACESLGRCDQAPPLDKLLKLIASDDRFEAWAARRVLERMPVGRVERASAQFAPISAC